MIEDLPYKHVIAADFEFEHGGNDANLPRPVCLVAKCLRTGQVWRVWRDEFGAAPPFPIDCDSLFVAYNAVAELSCFRVLGWKMPRRILDLYVEFRQRMNGLPGGRSLIDALIHFGLDHMEAVAKKDMIALILTGGPWTAEQRTDILDYCSEDVTALERLLPAMMPDIDLPRALLRGRYMAAVTVMEHHGIPIDVETLQRLRDRWDDIRLQLIADIDVDYGVYESGSFKFARFEEYVARHNLPWPKLPTGKLDTKDETFREMARSFPIISALRELRSSLSELRHNKLTIGDDGRNRTSLFAFKSKTGRNQPSTSKYIFGASVWLRGHIKPPEGFALAYIDWNSQEIGIAAALSGDENLKADFLSGDAYISFGIGAGLLPPGATKKTHADARNSLKTCLLGMGYGMGAQTLAVRIGKPVVEAQRLIDAHRGRYRKFWAMAEGAISIGLQGRRLQTVLGWQFRPGPKDRGQSLQNFPMQAHGAEMMRIAACLATERGIEVCAPVHDAFLICAPLERIDADVAAMQAAMLEASRLVLDGFEIPTEAKIVRWPDRYMDEERGGVMWDRVMALLSTVPAKENRNDGRNRQIEFLFD